MIKQYVSLLLEFNTHLIFDHKKGQMMKLNKGHTALYLDLCIIR